MKILVSGFEPFEGETLNPSSEAVQKLDDTIAGATIIKVEVPTVFGKAIGKIQQCIEQEKPNITMCVGQANGRFEINVEKVAINLNDARIPDNEGNQPLDETIFPDGAAAYFSNLPVKAMVQEIRKQRIPAAVSYSAGTFVCNHLMYGVLYLIDRKYPNMKGGFIHVPYTPGQVLDKKDTPSMALADIVTALTYAIKAAVENTEDIKIPGGQIA
jgi:pyroglutamyl-peptidase